MRECNQVRIEVRDLSFPVTLLAIIASDAIALPMAPGFPAAELRYILDDSEALALVTSKRFKSRAQEVLKEGLGKAPILSVLEKRLGGTTNLSQPDLQPTTLGNGGMMLYTSGTTNRPVRARSSLQEVFTDSLYRKVCYFQNLC